jgi:predicted AlkP superfamily phosphohydrolase/phosphomutase
VIKRLRSLKDPQTGETVMAEVYKNNEIYWGPKLNKVPDIIGIPNPRYYVDASLFTRSIFADRSSRQRGQHYAQVNGILIASGPDVKPCDKIEDAHLIDIAPTVLHMMGLPVPQDMDGRVLKELFRKDSEPAQRDVKYQQLDVERERVESKITNLKRLGRI